MIRIPLKQNFIGNKGKTIRKGFKVVTESIHHIADVLTQYHSALSLVDNTTVGPFQTDIQLTIVQQVLKSIYAFIDDYNIPPERLSFRYAICIPKSCSTQQVWNTLTKGNKYGIEYKNDYCRLADDTQWETADYVAMCIVSSILVLLILSTSFDIYMKIKKKDTVNKLYTSFSIYTNTRRLITFKSKSGTLECLDGMRTLAMLWVIVGHIMTQLLVVVLENSRDGLVWLSDWTAISFTAAPITVDTFFIMSGILVVYTTAGKYDGQTLIRKLHLFYLHRVLRMYPLLIFVMLFEMSLLTHWGNGPSWSLSSHKNNCVQNWWANLLFIQNLRDMSELCLLQTWYLAVDLQLYFFSPVLLFWVLSGSKRKAWISLITALVTFTVAVTIYVCIMKFPSADYTINRFTEVKYFTELYYYNTFTKLPHYIIGMIYGYILFLWKGKKLVLPKYIVVALWTCSFALLSMVLYSSNLVNQVGFSNQTVENVRNAFAKPAWALAIGWIVLACVHGYGGPINALLSMDVWRLPARLSYAVYLCHIPILQIIYSSRVQPSAFLFRAIFHDTLSFSAMSFLVAFVLMVTIDYPFSTLIDLCMDLVLKKKPSRSEETNRIENDDQTDTVKEDHKNS